VGRAWIEVHAARNPDAVLRAIKGGDFQMGFAPDAPEPEGRGFNFLGFAG
jgi:hypothetical protein